MIKPALKNFDPHLYQVIVDTDKLATSRNMQEKVKELSALWQVPLYYWGHNTASSVRTDDQGNLRAVHALWFRAKREHAPRIPLEPITAAMYHGGRTFLAAAAKLTPLSYTMATHSDDGCYPLLAAVNFDGFRPPTLLLYRPDRMTREPCPPLDYAYSELNSGTLKEQHEYNTLTLFLHDKRPKDRSLSWVAWLSLATIEFAYGVRPSKHSVQLYRAARTVTDAGREGYRLRPQVDGLAGAHVSSCTTGVMDIFGNVPPMIMVDFVEWHGFSSTHELVARRTFDLKELPLTAS